MDKTAKEMPPVEEILRQQEEELCIDLEENAILSAEFRQAEAAAKAGES